MATIYSTHGGKVRYQEVRVTELVAGDNITRGVVYDPLLKQCYETVVSVVSVEQVGRMVRVGLAEDGRFYDRMIGGARTVKRVVA